MSALLSLLGVEVGDLHSVLAWIAGLALVLDSLATIALVRGCFLTVRGRRLAMASLREEEALIFARHAPPGRAPTTSGLGANPREAHG
jgi:hypothetical protein